MKKIIFTLAAFAALSLSAATRQDPPPTQVNIDRNCPATVTAGTKENGSFAGTYTENKSKGYDARTTVTDRNGYSTNYHTGPGETSQYNGYYGSTSTYSNAQTSFNKREPNENVAKIDVTCSQVEK